MDERIEQDSSNIGKIYVQCSWELTWDRNSINRLQDPAIVFYCIVCVGAFIGVCKLALSKGTCSHGEQGEGGSQMRRWVNRY